MYISRDNGVDERGADTGLRARDGDISQRIVYCVVFAYEYYIKLDECNKKNKIAQQNNEKNKGDRA